MTCSRDQAVRSPLPDRAMAASRGATLRGRGVGKLRSGLIGVFSGVVIGLLAHPLLTDPALAATRNNPAAYQGWKITGLKITGVESDLEGELKSGLYLAGRRKILWRKYPTFSPVALQRDIERSRFFLARHGFPDARITAEFEADAEDREVDVILRADVGREILVIENRTTAFPENLQSRARKILEFEEGERFSDPTVERRVADLLRVLKENGYAYATVETRLSYRDPSHVMVEFVVDAGEIYIFGETVVQGVAEDLHEVARRTIAIESGRRYSPEPLRGANDNLRLLDLFRQIRLDTKPAHENRLDVVADLDERKMQSVGVGVGYWTEDQVRLQASYRHRNVLGAGQGISVEGSYSRFLQDAAVSCWRPAMFHSRTRGSVTLRGRREVESSYQLKTGEIELAATYVPSTITSLRPSITLSVIDVRSKTPSDSFETARPNLLSAAVSYIRADVDDRLNPSRGYEASLRIEEGLPRFDASRNYTLIEPQGSVYIPMRPFILAMRVGLGVAGPAADAAVLLPNKRFYAGGAGSMRGTKRKRLGPLDDLGRPVGGLVKAESTVEIRFPIYWRIGGAMFADAGQVWRRRGEVRPRDLRFAIGPALSVRTPVGPLRTEVGFLLGPRRPSEGLAVFHLSVGTSI